MTELICRNCGKHMFKKNITYVAKILGKEKEICKAQGYQCHSCGNMFFDKDVQDHIDFKKREITLEIMQNTDEVPLQISNLKNIRLEKKLSQKQVGNALGVTEQRYGAIERNTNTPTVFTVSQIASILDVGPEELYQLVYISKKFYDNIIDLMIVEGEDGAYSFEVASEVVEARKKLYALRERLRQLNVEISQARFNLKKGEITEDEFNDLVKELNKEKEKIKEIKDGKKGKKGLETTTKALETKYNLIIKQGNIISSDDWEKLKVIYKDEANVINYN